MGMDKKLAMLVLSQDFVAVLFMADKKVQGASPIAPAMGARVSLFSEQVNRHSGWSARPYCDINGGSVWRRSAKSRKTIIRCTIGSKR
ncbi:hypothetical protein DMH27_07810 [Raoultella planticola]|nr:hypothetical protein [Raoultella planticola]